MSAFFAADSAPRPALGASAVGAVGAVGAAPAPVSAQRLKVALGNIKERVSTAYGSLAERLRSAYRVPLERGRSATERLRSPFLSRQGSGLLSGHRGNSIRHFSIQVCLY